MLTFIQPLLWHIVHWYSLGANNFPCARFSLKLISRLMMWTDEPSWDFAFWSLCWGGGWALLILCFPPQDCQAPGLSSSLGPRGEGIFLFLWNRYYILKISLLPIDSFKINEAYCSVYIILSLYHLGGILAISFSCFLCRNLDFPHRARGKESACQCRRCGFHPWVKKILGRRKWQPTAVFLPWKFHGQSSLAGYSP